MIEDYQVKLKDGEQHCDDCHGWGFRVGCRAPDDCEEFECDECNCTGIKKSEVVENKND